MMESYLTETGHQQPWNVLPKSSPGLSLVTDPADGKWSNEITSVTDTPMSAIPSAAPLHDLGKLSHLNKCYEDRHKQPLSERQPVKQNNKSSLQSECFDERLSSRGKDAHSLPSS